MTISDIKADKAFEGWDFIRIGRLSVVPVPDAMWSRVEELASGGDPSARPATTKTKAPKLTQR